MALAAKLYKAGKTRHLDVLQGALDDSSRTVRYFAALQMASLGPKVGRPAVPVLQQILKTENDPDLVERAKLALLRLDRTALAEAYPAPRAASSGWIRVRIWEKGGSKPKLSLNLRFSWPTWSSTAFPMRRGTSCAKKASTPRASGSG